VQILRAEQPDKVFDSATWLLIFLTALLACNGTALVPGFSAKAVQFFPGPVPRKRPAAGGEPYSS
jgi:hypothetical protein